MIATVSTIKDTLTNVQRFVLGNLASGIDHLFIFLDAPDPEVEAWLSTRSEVTFVVTDKTWWNGARPNLLNRRQMVNANLLKALATRVPEIEWLFHIDADEIAQVDRAALAALPRSTAVVRLSTWESVSQLDAETPPNVYKRQLNEPELQLLCALDLLSEPSNLAYFRGHVVGKVGIRPQLDLWLRLHGAVDAKDKPVPGESHPGFRVLHNESYSGREFVRKWTALIGSGPSAKFRPERMPFATGIRALIESGLDTETTARYLTEIYRSHMEDPLRQLEELRLVERIDPLQGTHVPEVASDRLRQSFAALLEAMRTTDTREFAPGGAPAKQIAKTVNTIRLP